MIRAKAVDYAHDGRGVVKHEGKPVFVPDLLIGEEARIEIVSDRKSYMLGVVQERLNDSEFRVKPVCPYFDKCGGCQLQHMSYEHQLEMKTNRVSHALNHIAKLYVQVDDIKPSSVPLHYRNKIQMAFANEGKKLICGFYQAKSKKVINIDHCYIEHEEGNQIIQSLRSLLESYNLRAFDPKTNQGWIKHAIVKKGIYSKELMLIIVSQYEGFKKEAQIVAALVKKHPELTTIIHQANPSSYKVIGMVDRVIYGKGYIKDDIDGLTFRIKPQSFYQVNPVQAHDLYSKAIELAQITTHDHVLDAYCGVGTISLFAAKYAKHVTGIDIVSDAINDAQANADLNDMKNTTFKCVDATEYMKETKDLYDIVIVDPPRDGLQQPFIDALKVMKPKKFVYISCEPSSLARDLKQLKDTYHINKVTPVDMFSQTYHVETVTLLIRKEDK
ncbi:MAG: 23S rRNA (uracil(1939)-C(5))-methyltransferase RlmD [Acholeplasmataceae bacterium]